MLAGVTFCDRKIAGLRHGAGREPRPERRGLWLGTRNGGTEREETEDGGQSHAHQFARSRGRCQQAL